MNRDIHFKRDNKINEDTQKELILNKVLKYETALSL
jgi:hypothetical protein